MQDAMRIRRMKMRRLPAAALLSVLLAVAMAISSALATSAASGTGENKTVGEPPAKVNPLSDPKGDPFIDPRQRWPYADVTVPPRPKNSSSRDDEETVPSTCMYYARSSRGCSRPRTCRDCLEMKECMVNQFGTCVNITERGYEPSMDYHIAFKLNLTGSGASDRNVTLRYHFPAANATYCPADDATCLECKRTVFAGDVSDSRFCVGQNNCICIATCEATKWEQLAGGLRCGPPPRPKAFAAEGPPPWKPDDHDRDKDKDKDKHKSGVSWQEIWTMGGIPALVVVVGILVVRSNRLETKRRDEAARQQQLQLQEAVLGAEQLSNRGNNGGGAGQPIVTSSRRLNLAGWQASRQEDNKKAKSPVDDLSPKHHFVDLLDTRQSVNPQVTVLAAPVMGAVFVEASAPPMSPQHGEEGMEPPSAPSFDSEFEYEQEPTDKV
jgi:hypothetical protein